MSEQDCRLSANGNDCKSEIGEKENPSPSRDSANGSNAVSVEDLNENRMSKPLTESQNEKGQDEDNEEAVTMVDVLKEETELEADAQAVLGAADDQQCTYHTKGYAERQALYSCLTCCPNISASSSGEDFNNSNAKFMGGICLACSYQCHEKHNLVELYTKRLFRCDCGNETFPKSNPCQLVKDKKKRNEDNKYDQNFVGLYCTCHRPYPDPEDSTPDAMVQCIVCEDWYHTRHLNLDVKNVPDDKEYSELICFGCCEKFSFLKNYYSFVVENHKQDEKSSSSREDFIDVEKVKPEQQCLKIGLQVDLEKKVGRKLEDIKPKTMFLVEGWRKHLCKCDSCVKMYSDHDVSFLLNDEDTVHYYEAQSKKGESSQYESGMKALSEMERVKQVEAIQSYNSMKDNLMEYLKKFADNKKVVKREDIEQFFEEQKSKKPRLDNVPDFCR